MSAATCPQCTTPLGALATWCHVCEAYTADMQADGTPEKERAPVVVDTRLEEEIQRGIVEALKLLGCHVSDLSQGRRTRQTEGVPDLFVMGPRSGAFTWAEIKRPSTDLSDSQQAWHATAKSYGVPVEVWRSEGEAIAWVEAVRAVAA